MSKVISRIGLTALSALLLLTASCAAARPDDGKPAAEDPAPSASETTGPAASVTAPAEAPEQGDQTAEQGSAGFDFEEAVYQSGDITVTYPQIRNLDDAALQEALNELIAGAALRDMEAIKNDPVTYEISYDVAYNSPQIISIRFDGYSYYEGAAHPNAFLYSVTVDVQKRQTVTLPQLVEINEDFLRALLKGQYSAEGYDMTEEFAAAIRENLETMDDESWLEELKNADTPGYATASYLTENALVVSVSVPHVMGDHIEIILTYEDLREYRTDNPLWKTIDS